jgi:hypothetical protein
MHAGEDRRSSQSAFACALLLKTALYQPLHAVSASQAESDLSLALRAVVWVDASRAYSQPKNAMANNSSRGGFVCAQTTPLARGLFALEFFRRGKQLQSDRKLSICCRIFDLFVRPRGFIAHGATQPPFLLLSLPPLLATNPPLAGLSVSVTKKRMEP